MAQYFDPSDFYKVQDIVVEILIEVNKATDVDFGILCISQ